MYIQKFFSFFIATVLLCTFNQACKKSEPIDDTRQLMAILPGAITMEQSYIYGERLEVSVNNEVLDPTLCDWTSLDERIATVDELGRVFGLWVGETEIVAKARDGSGEARCKVTVWDKKSYKLRITLKDKGVTHHNINRPLEFLSQKAVDRRNRQSIPITATDLPISSDYLKQIQEIGGIIVAKSKWLNTVVVHVEDINLLEQYRKLPFVTEVIPVWVGYNTGNSSVGMHSLPISHFGGATASLSFDQNAYMKSWDNLTLNNGGVLHQNGFKGNDISIAVIDGGYENLDRNPHFSNSKIMEVKSFIYEQSNPYALGKHGLNVAGLMAINQPSIFIGTAPEATYWLFSTEDPSTEFAVEEDYLVHALEYADSVGVDVVNISLSYDQFDGFVGKSYKFEDMDGKTAFSSQAANLAFEKGMFVLSSAGNRTRWTSAPSDAPKVLTVGAAGMDSTITWFSSYGLTADGRIKPDIVSAGIQIYIPEPDGSISEGRFGTSFSTPIMTGLVACLWQAYPTLTNRELFDVILKSANRYSSPLLPYGYGLPNMEYALLLAKELTNKK